MSIWKAAGVCALINAALAALIARQSGVTDAPGMLGQVAFGVAIGAATALTLGAAIRTGHTLGYVLSAAILIALLTGTAWLASSTQAIVAAATMGLAVPLYAIAAVTTCILVHPVHQDRS